MKLRILAVVAVLAAGVTFSRAGITSVSISTYSGAMDCTNTPLEQIGVSTDNTYQMGVIGTQHDDYTATLDGYIVAGDPTLNMFHTINNDTLTVWSDYHVIVTMSQPFTFSSIIVTNVGWTFTTPSGTGPFTTGSIDFFAGGPSSYINPGDTLGFSFAINFTGNVSFSEALTPSVVPEPSAIALLACGLMGLFVIQRRLGT